MRAVRSLVVAVIATLLVILPVAAVAAPAAAPFKDLGAVLHEEQGQAILIIAATLADDVKLPATVAIPVPVGSELSWAGEVLGGDLSADIAAQDPTRTPAAPGWELLTFVATKSRAVQAEVVVPGSVSVSGGSLTASSTLWVPSNVPTATLAIRVPASAEIETSSAGLVPEPGPSGFVYLARYSRGVKAGQTLTASVTYGAVAGTAGTGGTTGTVANTPSSDGAVPFVVLAVALLLGGGVVAIVARMRARTSVGDDDEYEDDSYEEERPAKSSSDASAAPDAAPAVAPSAGRSRGPVIVGAAILVGVVAIGIALASVTPESIPAQAEGTQRVKVDTTRGTFNPSPIEVKADVPVELEFPPGGTGCAASISFPEFNIKQDIRRGGIVKLPALKAGAYKFLADCGEENQLIAK